MILGQNIWKYTQAVGSFKDAVKTIGLIKDAYNNGHGDLVAPLWIVFVVTYSKPFTNNKKIGKVSDNIVPSDLKKIHRSVLKVRNTTYGHIDPEETLDNGVPLNSAFFSVRDRLIIPDSKGIMPHDQEIDKFENLAEEVHNQAFLKLGQYLQESEEFRDLEDGDYVYDYIEFEGQHLRKISPTEPS